MVLETGDLCLLTQVSSSILILCFFYMNNSNILISIVNPYTLQKYPLMFFVFFLGFVIVLFWLPLGWYDHLMKRKNCNNIRFMAPAFLSIYHKLITLLMKLSCCCCGDLGLRRCSKSCRLRWTNYLRPGIKRGNFTEHEEKMILHLQALLGNR